MLPERRDPSHVLHLRVPLALDEADLEDNALVAETIRLCVAVSRAAYAGLVCDEVIAEIENAPANG